MGLKATFCSLENTKLFFKPSEKINTSFFLSWCEGVMEITSKLGQHQQGQCDRRFRNLSRKDGNKLPQLHDILISPNDG